MRTNIIYTLPEALNVEAALLNWAGEDAVCCLFSSNRHHGLYKKFDILFGVGAHTQLECKEGEAFKRLSVYRRETADWILGFLSYDLKNEVEALESKHPDPLNFPDLYFFQPLKLIQIIGNQIRFLYLEHLVSDIETDFERICNSGQDIPGQEPQRIKLKPRLSKEGYCKQVEGLLQHIKRGNIYEVNFCYEYYANSRLRPVPTFLKLNACTRAPFAAYFKRDDSYILCSSPERYLQKDDTSLISQPIKGTAARGSTPEEDLCFKKRLEHDPKERTENVMITDLVRNDLSRLAIRGSVSVPELCKIYSFEQVHQLISTVSARIANEEDPVNCIAKTFPMGSMTGAPKIAAMRLIESFENHKRGIYSGAMGYFSPEGDLDLNVIIRSILYRESLPYVSLSVGSAITAQAVPQQEYEECLIKAKAMRETLEC